MRETLNEKPPPLPVRVLKSISYKLAALPAGRQV